MRNDGSGSVGRTKKPARGCQPAANSGGHASTHGSCQGMHNAEGTHARRGDGVLQRSIGFQGAVHKLATGRPQAPPSMHGRASQRRSSSMLRSLGPKWTPRGPLCERGRAPTAMTAREKGMHSVPSANGRRLPPSKVADGTTPNVVRDNGTGDEAPGPVHDGTDPGAEEGDGGVAPAVVESLA